jgi:hypothetical protein
MNMKCKINIIELYYNSFIWRIPTRAPLLGLLKIRHTREFIFIFIFIKHVLCKNYTYSYAIYNKSTLSKRLTITRMS